MSLLWTQAVQHQAMPWNHDGNSAFTHHPVVHPVKNAGFASYTDDRDRVETWKETLADNGHDPEEFDEDLYDSSSPEMTAEEEAHQDEHGEPPESYHDRHHEAYEEAKRRKAQEDEPDHDDPDLANFISNHGSNTELWRKYGEHKPIDLTQPVHATQSHVSQTHIDRYKANPGDITEHQYTHGPGNGDYLGDQAPMFVTHHGALHATEGHHRTAAALQSGKSSIKGWHYDLDKDPARTKAQEEVEQDGSWKDPDDWDADDHEMYSGF